MKKNFHLVAACCMVVLTGCEQAEEVVNQSEGLVMSVEASIENSTESRYASSDKENQTPNSLVFDSGDKIGVFVADRVADEWENKGNGSWSVTAGTVYWPGKESTGYDFYAFYPYPSGESNISKDDVPMPSLADQKGTIGSLSDCDFMVATTHKAYTDNDGKVSFKGKEDCFKHVSSLVAITILKESDLKESVINKISFEGKDTDLGALTSYSFDTKSVKVITKNDKVEFVDLDVNMQDSDGDKPLYFILNSGANLANLTFTIEYSTGTADYIATKTNLGSGSLSSGNRYNFNLKITNGVLEISGNEIEEWGKGDDMEDIIINTPINNPNDEDD